VAGLIALLGAIGFVLARWQTWAQGSIGRFILVGRHFSVAGQLQKGIPVAPTYGYDGQFFYRLALNPLNFRHTAYGITMDRPYRYMRIGYPVVTCWSPWASTPRCPSRWSRQHRRYRCHGLPGRRFRQGWRPPRRVGAGGTRPRPEAFPCWRMAAATRGRLSLPRSSRSRTTSRT
jgi:hypothetical protein